MGTILSLIFGFSVASSAWNGQLQVSDLSLFLFALLAGMIFPRTVGISMVGVQVGAILAALFSLIRTDLQAIFVSIGIFLGSMLVQHLLTIFRPSASLSVGASTEFWDRYR